MNITIIGYAIYLCKSWTLIMKEAEWIYLKIPKEPSICIFNAPVANSKAEGVQISGGKLRKPRQPALAED